jgi:zinc protease
MRIPLCSLGLLLMLTPAFAKTPPPANPAIEFPATTAKKWILPDGLTVIVQEDHSAPVASVQAWCQTGSVDEDKHLGAGLSHILEHMLFKGTEKRSTNQIAQKIQDSGGYINAYTSYDRTVFWIDVPAKGVESAIDILSDAMMNSTLPPEEYKKEQEVIRREFAMGYDDPDRMVWLALFATAFREHPYRLPVIGHIEIYNKLSRDDVMEYYKARYVPNNLFFVVVGDVDAEKIHAQLEAYFADYQQKSLPPHYIPVEPQQLGRRESHTEFPTELTRLSMAWHIPDLTHPDMPALDLLSDILGSGRSSILYKKIREGAGLAHAISAFSYAPSDPGLFGIEATLDPDKRDATIKATLSIIDELKQHGISAADLDKAKKQALSAQLENLTTMRGKASDLGSNWLLTGNLDFSRDYLKALQAVTADDIKRVLHTYFDDKNLTIASLNPPGSLKAAAETAAPVAAGEIQKFELSNGLRLLVREDPRLPLVSAVATFKAGLLAETPDDNGITKLLSKVILKGTKTRTADQIADQIEAVGGGISSDAGNNSVSVSVKVTQPDLKLGLDILSDVLVNPTFPEKAVAREQEAQLAGIKGEEEEMTTVARNLLRANLFAGHPYGLRSSGTPESVGKLSQQALLDFHKKYITGRNGVIAVFGNVKAAEVKDLLEKQLAKLPAGEPELVNVAAPKPLTAPLAVEEHKQKAQAILMVGYLGADMFSPDRYALELIEEASSDLGSRFFIRIREKMGLAYFVGASQLAGLVPGPFVFYLGTSPAKVEQVKTELLDEISKLAHDGLTQEELTRAKEKLIGQQEIRNQSNDTFAYATALDELYGLGFDNYKKQKEAVAKITLEDVKKVANKYFADQPSILATVRPEPKPEAKPEQAEQKPEPVK